MIDSSISGVLVPMKNSVDSNLRVAQLSARPRPPLCNFSCTSVQPHQAHGTHSKGPRPVMGEVEHRYEIGVSEHEDH